MLTRREFATLALSTMTWPKVLAQTTVAGVTLGAQTYSFRQLPRPAGGDMVDVIIQAFTECGLRDCELWSPQLEPAATPPAKVPREELRQLAPRNAARSFHRHSQEVRSRQDRDSRIQLQLQRQLHGARNRSRLRNRARAGRRSSSRRRARCRRRSGSRPSPRSTRWSWRCTTIPT